MARLPVRHLADLHVSAPGTERAFVASGSGLELCSDHVWVAIDDDVHVGTFHVDSPETLRLVRVLPGALPTDHADRKRHKPDIETVACVGRQLLGIPSGSTERRRTGFTCLLDADGAMSGAPRQLDWSELVGALARELDEVNVEGAVAATDRMLLLCRGTGGRNHVGTLALDALLEDVARGEITARSLEHVRPCEVGELDGVALGFTDAACVDGRVLVSAAAEATTNAYDDGLVAGSVVGWLSADGSELVATQRIDSADKVEGLAVRSTTGSELVAWLVTDNDEPRRPARLLEVRVPRQALV